MCQVPAPSAAAWLVDLVAARGPRFVVLRGGEPEARRALVEHLVATGRASDLEEAQALVEMATAEPVGVIW